jgi:hypothetical protein
MAAPLLAQYIHRRWEKIKKREKEGKEGKKRERIRV